MLFDCVVVAVTGHALSILIKYGRIIGALASVGGEGVGLIKGAAKAHDRVWSYCCPIWAGLALPSVVVVDLARIAGLARVVD